MTNLDPTCLGGKKRERERKREKGKELRVRSSHLSLDFPVNSRSNLGETNGKVDPLLQEVHVGTGIVEFRQTPGGKGFVTPPTRHLIGCQVRGSHFGTVLNWDSLTCTCLFHK